jgi:ABC-type glycerol-3-phosphate transport system substrate-binding protein
MKSRFDPPATQRRRRIVGATLGVVGVVAIALSGCASAAPVVQGQGAFTPVPQDDAAGITVWVDATRQAAADAYVKAYPDDKVTVESVDLAELQTKVSLFDKAKKGWPDVTFYTGPQAMSWATAGTTPYAAPLNEGLIPTDTIDKFADTSLDPCEVDGTLYCLRNDLAQNVFWYNTKLFDEFGYDVPTTWEESWEASEMPSPHTSTFGPASAQLISWMETSLPRTCPTRNVPGWLKCLTTWLRTAA